MTTIATSNPRARLMLDLVVAHVLACDVFRRDSNPVVPGVVVPTERSIVLQMECLHDIIVGILAADPGTRPEIDRIVGSLVDDLRISENVRPWISRFEDLETVVSAIRHS
jgi:hypothetical protein